MKPEKEKHIQGTSRQDEEKHLKETLAVIHANMESFGRQVREMKADIDEMLEHYHDNDAEVYTILTNTVTLHDHMKRALERNEKAQNKPYFGRICFHDESLDKDESLYIGKGGISSDTTHQTVIDWRAPVANVYYENGLGQCSYQAPDGKPLNIDLQLKRTYEIEQGKLLDYFDSEVISNDDLLTKYLARNKQAVLGEIVATIQKEQNEIIRKSPYHNVIVQGVAGSGKTTVAMHRISYILYNYQDRFRPEDFYIVGSNRILLNYITGVLPDLDVYGVRQMTMEQLFIRLLYEDWDPKKYRIRKADPVSAGRIKGSGAWFQALKDFCDDLEQRIISMESIYLNPRQFVEGIQNGESGVFDQTNGQEADPEKLILLADGQAVRRYVMQNPKISIQSKINMLNERLLIKVRDEFSGKGIKYTEAEKKAILKAHRNRYGSGVWKQSTYALYDDFLRRQADEGYPVDSPKGEYDVYDLAALAYIYKRTKETEVISEAHHMVIDEAQDFGMMIYDCLHFCVTGCTYTIMGDVSQNIRFGVGLNDWEALRALILSDEMDSFGILKKSYRNTVEISEFATNILHHGGFVTYPVEPIIRHGNPVKMTFSKAEELWRRAAEICRDWQERSLPTIAVVCRNRNSALRAAEALGKHIPLKNSLENLEEDLEKTEFGSGIMVLPVEYTKGLEFDAVLILDPSREEYPVDDGHARLLYVAATRALHELCVLHTGNLTGLIADPILENRKPAPAPRESARPAAPAPGSREHIRPAAPAPGSREHTRPTVVVPASRKNVRPAAVPSDFPQISRKSAGQAAADLPHFGDLPSTEKLRPSGHAKVDLSVRWVLKQADGLYLQSRYGILRLSPIGSGIIRVTFAKGSKILDITHPRIRTRRIERFWTYQDTGGMVILSTEELILQAEKNTGAIRYLTRGKKLLLAERNRECRQAEAFPRGGAQYWLFLEYVKKEQIFALGPKDQQMLPLRQTARYISHEEGLPFLFSDQGFGILTASENPVISCDLPSYGTYLHTEGEEQLDFYFIAGKTPDTLMNACRFLMGEL